VELEYENREDAVADEVVWMAATPIGVAPAATWEEWEWSMVEGPPGTFTLTRSATPTVRRTYGSNSIVVRGMDRTRWERSLPLAFGTIASITANSAADGSGTAIAIALVSAPPPAPTALADTLHVWWQPAGSSGTLTFFNQRATPVFVRTLTINGRPARTVSPWSVSVVDQEGTDIHGDVGLTIANPYLPSADAARERGREMLFFRAGMRARLDLPALDGVPFLHPYDAFAFTDDSVTPARTIPLMVVRHEWDYSGRGYTSALRCAPALPPTDQSTADAVPPGAETITTATAAPPWSWANPYATVDVFAVDDPRPWAAETIAGYPANRALLAVAEGDAPAGNPVPRSLRLTLTGLSDQGALTPFPAPMRVGVTYTISFWIRLHAGSGQVQWVVGRRGTAGGDRAHSWGQTIGATWVQRSINWTPSGTDAHDPVLAILGWGGVTLEARLAGVRVTHGAPVNPLIFDWSEWG
ncbi:MAG TPA: hypothetical protein VLH81_02180, partial [Desulfobacterales bacterium]|nr:hypothetical protein [Desulfobacterales bacterium]